MEKGVYCNILSIFYVIMKKYANYKEIMLNVSIFKYFVCNLSDVS